MILYHHTDTARLPFILRTGELRPGANRIGGYPDPDFLWATTDPNGDRTSAADRGEHYRTGKTRHVRFTLDAGRFFPWSEVPARHPRWTPDQIARLEAAARGKSNPSAWWCGDRTIPLANCIAIETRSYRDNRWRLLDPKTVVFALDNGWVAVEIAGTVFLSKTHRHWTGADAYEVLARAA